MKILFPFAFIIIFSFSLSAQKVKIKKKVAYVEDKAYLDLSETVGSTTTYKSLNGNELFVVHLDSYQKRNPVAKNPRSNAPYKPYVTVYYATIKFLNSDIEFETKDLSNRKVLIKALYNNQVLNENGQVIIEEADKFAKKYGQNVSANKPLEIFTN